MELHTALLSQKMGEVRVMHSLRYERNHAVKCLQSCRESGSDACFDFVEQLMQNLTDAMSRWTPPVAPSLVGGNIPGELGKVDESSIAVRAQIRIFFFVSNVSD